MCEHFTAEAIGPACGLCDVCTGTIDVATDAQDTPGAPRRAPAKAPRARAATKTKPAARTRLARGTQRISGVKFDLDTFRKRTARQLRWKPYMVLQQGVIAAIDEAKPTSLEALARIAGLGPAKIARFGREILAIVARNRQ
ncbi:MAG: HRDC domain-containing protein [Myxococcales bacterium]|nr:HRDC domain-containing protein [Myxococcales bacterium]